MTDEEALFAGVLAAPDDDVPRLVYADWLEEHGQEDRAEYIRVQIERAGLPKTVPRYKECVRRERVLFARNKAAWMEPFQFWPGGGSVRFERGFVSIVKATTNYFKYNAEELWRRAPVREVYVTDGRSHVRELCWLPRPPQVRVRVGLVPSRDHLPTVTIDALPPSPSRMEPCLRTGTWLILGYARAGGSDAVAVARFSDYVTRHGGPHGAVNFGVRPYQVASEFRAWCPIPDAAPGPHWLLLKDGKLAAYSSGGLDADSLGPTFWNS
jgi:uncharacterized protein (TIGR02996 family)